MWRSIGGAVVVTIALVLVGLWIASGAESQPVAKGDVPSDVEASNGLVPGAGEEPADDAASDDDSDEPSTAPSVEESATAGGDERVPEFPRSEQPPAEHVVRTRVEAAVHQLRSASSDEARRRSINVLAAESGAIRDAALLETVDSELSSGVREAAAIALAGTSDVTLLPRLRELQKAAPSGVRMAIATVIAQVRERNPDERTYFRLKLAFEPTPGDHLSAAIRLTTTSLLRSGAVASGVQASGESSFPEHDFEWDGELARGASHELVTRLTVAEPGFYVIRGAASLEGDDGHPRVAEERLLLEFHTDRPPSVAPATEVAAADLPTPPAITESDGTETEGE